MRPPTTYEAANVQASKKSPSSLRLRPRRRSLIGRSRAVPFSAGALGSLRQRSEDDADEQLIVSLRDRNSVDTQTGAPLQTNGQALQEYLMVLTPQRLPYEIQMASGWDKGFPPEELVGLMQTSAGKGWHTPRFCGYPQDLVLRFSCGHSRIRKIQMLSHQYKIASRLDFWMGSRKGVQSIDTGFGAHAGEDSKADHDNNRGEGDGGGYEDEDEEDELDLIPRMDVRKRSLPVLQFQKLGSISFDSNTASNYSGRELKSINVDVEGEYLRVVIRQCHVNPLNIYHQVAILALNVLGEPLEDELQGESERLDFDECEIVNGPGHGLSEPSLAHSLVPVTDIPDVPSLSDAVRALSIAEIKSTNYLDPDVQRVLSGFLKAKQDAVRVEDFALAKLYKTGYENMSKFADEIQALDIQKQQAAEHDEFDLAQELKAKVADAKTRMNSRLARDGFYAIPTGDVTVISMTNPHIFEDEHDSDRSLSVSKSFSAGDISTSVDPRNVSTSSIGNIGRRIPVSRRSIPPAANLNRGSSATSDNSSDPEKVRRVDYSGKIPLPFSRSQSQSAGFSERASEIKLSIAQSTRIASQKSSHAPQYQSGSLNGTKDRSSDSGSRLALEHDEINSVLVDELTEQDQISFAVSLQIFSSKVVSCLLCRELHLRLYAIEFVKEHLENESVADDIDQEGDRSLLARASFQVISVALTDTREKVVTLALALLDQVVKFCLQNEVPSAVTYRSLEPIFSLLLVKSADLNTRVAQGTIDRIVMLCNCFTTSPHAIIPLVFKPARSTVLYRQSQSRIEIVARLVDEFGVFDRAEGKGTPGGLDFENITEFAVPYLSHTNGEVRVATRKLIIDVCKFLNKTRVEQFLPGVKPLIIESIQKDLVPKKSTPISATSPFPSRLVSQSAGVGISSSRLSVNASTAALTSGKRRPAPTSIGVNLHMDSLKSLLVEPDSPGLSRTGRQSSRQRSDAAIAHQARLKLPLRSSVKAQHALYVGVPRTMVKRQSALSPDDENDSTASEEIKPLAPRTSSMAPKTAVRPLQPKSKSSSSLTSKGRQNLSAEHLSSSDSQKGPDVSRSAKDRFCVFCDERNNAFTDEGLVVHYWNDCAMLANCSYCKIIIEVPTLAEHMLKECAKRKFVKQCENCNEIMAADTFLAHVASGCFAEPDTTVRCPLCQLILPSNNESEWKKHLLNGPGCPMNKKSPAKSQDQKQGTPILPSTGTLLPPVNTSTHGYKALTTALSGSPTSPLSSSSSSSIRIDSVSGRYRGPAPLSATVSPASSTTSSVVDSNKSGIPQYNHSMTLSSVTSSHLSLRTQQHHPVSYGADLHHQPLHPHTQHQDSIHPLDPSPSMISPNISAIGHSPSFGSLSSNQALGSANNSGSSSRIPKLGNFRSSSSNSISSMAWK